MANTIYTEKPKKNKFDLSREVKMTGNMGWLYPCFIQDIIPGDALRVQTQQLVRFSPLLAPMMHNIDFKIDYFFVPYRIIWDEWKDFITGGEDGNDLPSYPRFEVNQYVAENILYKGSLADYLGVPPIYTSTSAPDGVDKVAQQKLQGALQGDLTKPKNRFDLSVLPFRAYQLIYHEYFRDQNVGQEWQQYTNSGYQQNTQLAHQTGLRMSNWQKDYFTSALPFLQRGPEVTLPLGDKAPLLFEDSTNASKQTQVVPRVDMNNNSYQDMNAFKWYSGDNVTIENNNNSFNIDVTRNTTADLTQATAATINELRKATALQRWLELMARAGSRYREQIHAIFGERIPDYTVQIPQYLGGGKTPIMISEILSTYTDSSTTSDSPQGDMTGHALGLGDGIGFQQNFDEHGIILGLARIIPQSSYTQGLSKFWQKFDKFDHYFPQFANLGEQEVHNKELYLMGDEYDNDVFGYQQRYAEYKYSFNRVAGDFRDELAFWELSRRFNGHQNLNQGFIECNPDTRIFAVTENEVDKVWMNLHHKVDALRPMPYHSNPSLT